MFPKNAKTYSRTQAIASSADGGTVVINEPVTVLSVTARGTATTTAVSADCLEDTTGKNLYMGAVSPITSLGNQDRFTQFQQQYCSLGVLLTSNAPLTSLDVSYSITYVEGNIASSTYVSPDLTYGDTIIGSFLLFILVMIFVGGIIGRIIGIKVRKELHNVYQSNNSKDGKIINIHD